MIRLRSNPPRTLRILAGAALWCLLVMAEASAVMHSLDFDAHTTSEPCKICISFAGFGDAVPAGAAVLLPVSASNPGVFHAPVSIVSVSTERPNARGPPQVS